jgi:hypothetical protein
MDRQWNARVKVPQSPLARTSFWASWWKHGTEAEVAACERQVRDRYHRPEFVWWKIKKLLKRDCLMFAGNHLARSNKAAPVKVSRTLSPRRNHGDNQERRAKHWSRKPRFHDEFDRCLKTKQWPRAPLAETANIPSQPAPEAFVGLHRTRALIVESPRPRAGWSEYGDRLEAAGSLSYAMHSVQLSEGSSGT